MEALSHGTRYRTVSKQRDLMIPVYDAWWERNLRIRSLENPRPNGT
jgi:hypothetical protein